jgi:Fe-S-cluster containining protein
MVAIGDFVGRPVASDLERDFFLPHFFLPLSSKRTAAEIPQKATPSLLKGRPKPALAMGPNRSSRIRYAQQVAVRFPTSGDQKLIQIVDAALADAAHRSREWLACRPGCTQCCIGVFAINQLDGLRLRRGLAQLKKRDPDAAAAVVERARESWSRLRDEFPGNRKTGILDENEKSAQKFDEFANEEPCPALHPVTGRCELYESRPITCRVFGPPVRSEGGLGVCELCFQGASEKDIAACEMLPDPDDLESRLLQRVEESWEIRGNTIVAYALLD